MFRFLFLFFSFFLVLFSSLPPSPLAQMRFWPRTSPRDQCWGWGSGLPHPSWGFAWSHCTPRAAQCPERGSRVVGGLHGHAGVREPLPAPQLEGRMSLALPPLTPGCGVVGLCGRRGSIPLLQHPASLSVPHPLLCNKYLYCAVQNTSASPPRREGSLPAPSVTWGTPCRVTAPAGSPTRSPVSGCFAVR